MTKNAPPQATGPVPDETKVGAFSSPACAAKAIADDRLALARERLIVALDFPTPEPALRLAQELGNSAGWLKVGKQLFTAAGPDLVRRLIAADHRVFLDLKFHDIPNTVAGAVGSAAALGVGMVNVHASGGRAMLQAAVAAAAESAARGKTKPLVLAVTVLTSLGDADLAEIGIAGPALDQVLRLAELAFKAGCDGVVASAREAQEIRKRIGPDFLIATPGIRPTAEKTDDQSRTLTAAEAIRSGASYLVVGRPINAAQDPHAAAEQMVGEIAAALP
jgi:orotidine-5'-phosphate decarboxylase